MKILLIDDDKDLTNLIKNTLKKTMKLKFVMMHLPLIQIFLQILTYLSWI
ncbi:hypothetical protein [Anaerococcus cruorum]